MGPSDWKPGDPLPLSSVAQERPMFELIDSNHRDYCAPCSDAARWPEPFSVNSLEVTL